MDLMCFLFVFVVFLCMLHMWLPFGVINKLVRPRWPYDMRPSLRAEKYMCVIVIR